VSAFIAVHLALALFALALGVVMLVRTKGTASHKLLGRVWVGAIVVVSLSSFWIRTLHKDGSFSAIHLLSIWTLIAVAIGLWAIRTGRLRTHRGFMIGTFSGLVIAGIFAAFPGRIVGDFLLSMVR
jgi:uncharacterized membrane protein